jgi:hypothetical protein
MDKSAQIERNVRIELTKAKLLLNSENKELAFEVFFNILNNISIDLKYRIEALGYLALNKLSLNEVINILKDILLKENLSEFDIITLARKFKEMNKLDELANIITDVINNTFYNSNKRFYLIKVAFDFFDNEFKTELINKISLSDNPVDFLNLVSVIKENTTYRELIKTILLKKLKDTSDFFNKIVYYNIFANLYGVNELYNLIIDDYERFYKIDYLILLYVLLVYFRAKNLLSNLENFIEINFKDSFIYIFFYNLKKVIINKESLVNFLNFEELYNQNKNLFLAFIGFIFTKNLIQDFSNYIGNFKDYRGAIFKRLINSFINQDIVDIINNFDISNGENEYFIEEQAIIELNNATFSNLYQEFELVKQESLKESELSKINSEFETNENIKNENIKEEEIKIDEVKSEEIESKEKSEFEETKIDETKIIQNEKNKQIEQINEAEQTINKLDQTKDTQIEYSQVKSEEPGNQIENIENEQINIENEQIKTDKNQIDENQIITDQESIISEVEKDIEKIFYQEITDEITDEITNEITNEITDVKENEEFDVNNFIKNFSNFDKKEIEDIKELIMNNLKFKEDFFIKLEDYILNESNIKNEFNNIVLLLNFLKNIDNNIFHKLIKVLVSVLLEYNYLALYNILSSTVGISKVSLKEYFVDNDLLDFNLNINNFIEFIEFIVNNKLENVEEVTRLLVYLNELNELNNDSKTKINSLVSKLIKLI